MLLFMDGFSHYATADLDEKWSVGPSGTATWTIASEGRSDGCVKKACTSTQGTGLNDALVFSPYVTQSGAWTSQDVGILGFALKITNLAGVDAGIGVSGNGSVFTLRNLLLGVENGAYSHFGIQVNANGTLTVYSGGGVSWSQVGTSVEAITEDTWHYLEFKWTIGDTGSLTIYSNGVAVFTNASMNLSWDAAGFSSPPDLWTSIRVLGQGSATGHTTTWRMCDLYLLDDSGSYNNDVLGDVSVNYIVPTGAGNATTWTPSAGSNWDCVEEVGPDGDTTYVSTTTINNRDSYTFGNVVSDPLGIQICTYVRTVTTGAAGFKPVCRVDVSGTPTNYEFIEFGVADTSYVYALQPSDTSPDTSVRWTKTEIDDTEFGILKTG